MSGAIELGLVAWLLAGTVFALWIRRRDRQRRDLPDLIVTIDTSEFEAAMAALRRKLGASQAEVTEFAAATRKLEAAASETALAFDDFVAAWWGPKGPPPWARR